MSLSLPVNQLHREEDSKIFYVASSNHFFTITYCSRFLNARCFGCDTSLFFPVFLSFYLICYYFWAETRTLYIVRQKGKKGMYT